MPITQPNPAYPEIFQIKDYDPWTHRAVGLDWLHQDETWRTESGEILRLEDMTPSHRANALRWLRRRAAALELYDGLAMFGSPLGAPRGDAACDAVDALMAERCSDPAGWLESTPLVKRLAALVAEDEAAKYDWIGPTADEERELARLREPPAHDDDEWMWPHYLFAADGDVDESEFFPNP